MTADDLPKTPKRRSAPFRLGDLEVRPASGEVVRAGGTERLRPILMEILLRLAAEPGEVVRRETLLEEAWERRMVNDEVLSRAIAELRTALGDDARAARYIETLPKIGYRLVAPVADIGGREAGTGAPGSTPMPSPARAFPARAWLVAATVGTLAAWAIATAVHRPGRDELETMLTAARPFTSDPALEVGPRFSPDGRFIAFALGEGATSRIVVQSIADSSRRTIGDGGDLRLSPVFFPDGKRLALWRRAGDDCAIVEHDLESGAEKRLLDCSLVPRARFDLSPDGRQLVFSGQAHAQAPAGLWLAGTDGTAPAALTSPDPGTGEDILPRFSPDGRHVAFFRGNESHRRAWTVDLDGGRAARQAGAAEGLVYGAAWLGPKGPLLVAADWFGFRALNVLDPGTGQARLVGGRGARAPDVGPGGEVVWENVVYTANLWWVGQEGEPRASWRSTRYSSQPEFSPDGKQVAFASNRDGTDAIYVASPGAEPRRIAFGDAYRYMRPHWSADGRSVHAVRVTLGAKGAGIQEPVRIPVEGGAAEILAIPGQVNDVRESADGRWLYWGTFNSGAMQLWRAPRSDLSRSERLPLPAMSHYQINAGRIVFAQPQLTRLTACRLETLACAPLEPPVPAQDLYHWAIGPRSLYLRVREEGRVGIARFDLESGRRVATIAVPPSGAGTSIAASPDESVLVVAREEPPAVDLMIARP